MPASALLLKRSIRTQQKAALRVARSCLLPSAYQVHYRRAGEPNWNFAGTIETRSPIPALSVPEVTPGEYEVDISIQGFAWNPHYYGTRTRFRIVDSGAEFALPAVSDLQAALEGNSFVLSWLWKPELGTQVPSEFAIWVSLMDTLDTQAVPADLVPADGNRRHYARIPFGAGRFSGVAARHNGQVGPLAIVALPQPSTALPFPEDQYARPIVAAIPR